MDFQWNFENIKVPFCAINAILERDEIISYPSLLTNSLVTYNSFDSKQLQCLNIVDMSRNISYLVENVLK